MSKPEPYAMALRTAAECLRYAKSQHSRIDEFDRGYHLGMAEAIRTVDTLRHQWESWTEEVT